MKHQSFYKVEKSKNLQVKDKENEGILTIFSICWHYLDDLLNSTLYDFNHNFKSNKTSISISHNLTTSN